MGKGGSGLAHCSSPPSFDLPRCLFVILFLGGEGDEEAIMRLWGCEQVMKRIDNVLLDTT